MATGEASVRVPVAATAAREAIAAVAWEAREARRSERREREGKEWECKKQASKWARSEQQGRV